MTESTTEVNQSAGSGHSSTAIVLLLFATLLFGLAVRSGSSLDGVTVMVATAALAGSFSMRRNEGSDAFIFDRRMESRLLIAVVIFGLLGVSGWAPSAIGPSSTELETLPSLIWIALAITTYVLRNRSASLWPAVIVTLTIAVTLFVGLLHLAATDGIGLDVYSLHVEAADALASGLNPYTDAVEVENRAPTAELGDVITGYVYPPVTAVLYSLGQWTFADPRFTSLGAWILVLTLVGLTAVKEHRLQNLYLMLLLAAVPGWPLVLRAAWTEPLSLAFLAIAFFLWRRPVASGVGLGLALASKQYFLVSAPLVLLHRDHGWRKRVTVATIVVAVTVGVALVSDAAAFWRSAIEFHIGTPPRPDSSNIVGLLAAFGVSWAPPAILTLGAGLAAASVAGRVSRNRGSFILAMGLTLAISFLASSQAFANYWFLIFGLCVLGLAASPTEQDSSSELTGTISTSSPTGRSSPEASPGSQGRP
jgi:hypothetical protein